jgi:hypothetical protein
MGTWRTGPLAPPRGPAGSTGALTARAIVSGLAGCAGGHALRPDYDVATLEWTLGVLAGKRAHGQFRQAQVLGADGRAVGWYLYFAKPGGVGQVVQIAAGRQDLDAVIDHLFYDAWRSGTVAVTGQVEPRLVPALSRALTLLHPDNSSVLAHSPHPGVLEALGRGDAFLSRLDGEWWIN